MVEHFRRIGVHLSLVHERHAEDAALRFAAKQEIAGDVDRIAERKVLVNHLDALAARVGRRSEANLLAVERDASGIRDDRAGQDLAQSRFACTVVADEAEHLAGTQREIDPIQRLDRTKGLADVLHPHPDRRVIAQHRRLFVSSLTHLPYGWDRQLPI